MKRFISILFCALTANSFGMSSSESSLSYSSVVFSSDAAHSEANSPVSLPPSFSSSATDSPDVLEDLNRLVAEALARSVARLPQPEQAPLTQPLRRKDPCGKIIWTKQDAQWSPLHRLATQPEKTSTLSTLLATKRFPVDALDENGWTPLMLAVFSGNFAGVNMLLGHGACADIYAHRLKGRNRSALVTLLSRDHQSVTKCCGGR